MMRIASILSMLVLLFVVACGGSAESGGGRDDCPEFEPVEVPCDGAYASIDVDAPAETIAACVAAIGRLNASSSGKITHQAIPVNAADGTAFARCSDGFGSTAASVEFFVR